MASEMTLEESEIEKPSINPTDVDHFQPSLVSAAFPANVFTANMNKYKDQSEIEIKKERSEIRIKEEQSETEIEEWQSEKEIQEWQTEMEIEERQSEMEIEEGQSEMEIEEGQTETEIEEEQIETEMVEEKSDIGIEEEDVELILTEMESYEELSEGELSEIKTEQSINGISEIENDGDRSKILNKKELSDIKSQTDQNEEEMLITIQYIVEFLIKKWRKQNILYERGKTASHKKEVFGLRIHKNTIILCSPQTWPYSYLVGSCMGLLALPRGILVKLSARIAKPKWCYCDWMTPQTFKDQKLITQFLPKIRKEKKDEIVAKGKKRYRPQEQSTKNIKDKSEDDDSEVFNVKVSRKTGTPKSISLESTIKILEEPPKSITDIKNFGQKGLNKNEEKIRFEMKSNENLRLILEKQPRKFNTEAVDGQLKRSSNKNHEIVVKNLVKESEFISDLKTDGRDDKSKKKVEIAKMAYERCRLLEQPVKKSKCKSNDCQPKESLGKSLHMVQTPKSISYERQRLHEQPVKFPINSKNAEHIGRLLKSSYKTEALSLDTHLVKKAGFGTLHQLKWDGGKDVIQNMKQQKHKKHLTSDGKLVQTASIAVKRDKNKVTLSIKGTKQSEKTEKITVKKVEKKPTPSDKKLKLYLCEIKRLQSQLMILRKKRDSKDMSEIEMSESIHENIEVRGKEESGEEEEEEEVVTNLMTTDKSLMEVTEEEKSKIEGMDEVSKKSSELRVKIRERKEIVEDKDETSNVLEEIEEAGERKPMMEEENAAIKHSLSEEEIDLILAAIKYVRTKEHALIKEQIKYLGTPLLAEMATDERKKDRDKRFEFSDEEKEHFEISEDTLALRAESREKIQMAKTKSISFESFFELWKKEQKKKMETLPEISEHSLGEMSRLDDYSDKINEVDNQINEIDCKIKEVDSEKGDVHDAVNEESSKTSEDSDEWSLSSNFKTTDPERLQELEEDLCKGVETLMTAYKDLIEPSYDVSYNENETTEESEDEEEAVKENKKEEGESEESEVDKGAHIASEDDAIISALERGVKNVEGELLDLEMEKIEILRQKREMEDGIDDEVEYGTESEEDDEVENGKEIEEEDEVDDERESEEDEVDDEKGSEEESEAEDDKESEEDEDEVEENLEGELEFINEQLDFFRKLKKEREEAKREAEEEKAKLKVPEWLFSLLITVMAELEMKKRDQIEIMKEINELKISEASTRSYFDHYPEEENLSEHTSNTDFEQSNEKITRVFTQCLKTLDPMLLFCLMKYVKLSLSDISSTNLPLEEDMSSENLLEKNISSENLPLEEDMSSDLLPSEKMHARLLMLDKSSEMSPEEDISSRALSLEEHLSSKVLLRKPKKKRRLRIVHI